MSLRNKIVSTIGIAALGLSMTSGIALADTEADANADLNVTCPGTPSVTLTANGVFEVDQSAVVGNQIVPETSATLVDGFTIVLDLTCNWSSDFEVSAKIGQFEFQGGNVPEGSAQNFPGSRFDMVNGSSTYVGVNSLIPLAGPPQVNSDVLTGIFDDEAIENDVAFFFFPVASPGITTATWDGELNNLPVNLADGLYRAPLTIDLSVD